MIDYTEYSYAKVLSDYMETCPLYKELFIKEIINNEMKKVRIDNAKDLIATWVRRYKMYPHEVKQVLIKSYPKTNKK
jgi:hypothetical protein